MFWRRCEPLNPNSCSYFRDHSPGDTKPCSNHSSRLDFLTGALRILLGSWTLRDRVPEPFCRPGARPGSSPLWCSTPTTWRRRRNPECCSFPGIWSAWWCIFALVFEPGFSGFCCFGLDICHKGRLCRDEDTAHSTPHKYYMS